MSRDEAGGAAPRERRQGQGEYVVRPYEPGDEEGILDLFYEVFREDNPDMPRRPLALWRQLFADNPAGLQCFVAEDEAGKIIANYASMPAFCSVEGERRLCTQIVDTAVDRAWRRSLRKKSVFVVVGREFLSYWCVPGEQPYNEYIYGLPNERAYKAGTRILGYKPVLTPMPTRVLVFDDARLAALGTHARDVEVEEFDVGQPEVAAALFESHLDEVPLGTWRDAAYLRWRYRERAGVVYRGLLARRGGQPVMAAWFRLGWADKSITPVVDWVGPGGDTEAVAALLGAAARITAAERGWNRVETWVMPQTTYWDSLDVLELGEEPSNFNLCIIDSMLDHDFEWARTHWFFTMGDSDIF